MGSPGKYLLTVIFVLVLVTTINGHGRLIDPPGRSSIWKFIDQPQIAPYESIVEINYQDHELYCGGFAHQQNLGGKCGVCGDPWDAAIKENEAGGKYAKGIIVRQYPLGSQIDATVEITAYHKGYFEFRICPWNDRNTPVTQECLNEHVLNMNDGEMTKWMIPTPSGGSSQLYTVPLYLPDDMECDQCVLQWKYHTGNSWGYNDDGLGCVGCGPQEEFYGCADIAIGNGPTLPPIGFEPTVDPSVTSTTKPTTTSTTKAITTPTTEPTTTSTTESTTTTTTTTTTQSIELSSTPTSTALPITSSSTTASTTWTTDIETPNCQFNENGVIKENGCFSFYMCSNGIPYAFSCGVGTVFNKEINQCDHPYNTLSPCGTKEV